ncbi:hypothetical protein CAT7_06613 [Carnobacterium sp. AT7]|uniref:hypothetical protein n=1 Tax=Carnobacterium TaxID=2747 RepID=UPI00015F2B9A|nr:MULTISPECIES: hypothetical protein [Carnobacterium]EDP68892.1 hypothetical protein CAT7_06613 [Carnobacterium sp. AT7]
MDENDNIMKVNLAPGVYKVVKEYCSIANIDENEFVNSVMNYFLEENLIVYDTMRKGYAEMSRINLDICDEFEVCEKEVGAQF